ncbi:MAG: ribulose-phosphate 3-epimerase [Chloroflexota bacterium]|nr:ribulose-phosphate 3-epimerase [Chloroflexota bacterium]
MPDKIKIAPSILSADFARLGEQVAEVTVAGADYIHIDVMDGHFVPPITIGPIVVEAVRRWTDVPLDVHLMIDNPERHIEQFAGAGADIITVHAEAANDLGELIESIKNLGVKAGVSINPATPIDAIENVLSSVDLVLAMTVNPGWAGQAFMEEVVDKIVQLRRIMDRRGFAAELEVDGGISPKTARRVVEAGGRVLVAGSAIFTKGKSVAETMAELRVSCGDVIL